jgi:hypothetical protein
MCSVLLISDDEAKIKCGGYCNGEFHGCCVGLPRKWNVTSTNLTRFVSNHFICSSCQALPDVVIKIDEIWTTKFNELTDKLTELNNSTIKRLKTNESAFKELSDNVEQFSRNLDDIDQHQKLSLFQRPGDTSLMLDLTSKRTRTYSTQTDEPISTTDNPVALAGYNEILGGEWRFINSKRVWKKNWTDFDAKFSSLQKEKMKKQQQQQQQHRNNNNKKQKPPSQDNFYQMLANLHEADPTAHCSNNPNFDMPSVNQSKPRQIKQSKPKSMKKANINQRKDANNFDEILNDYNLNFFEPAPPKYPNFQLGSILNQKLPSLQQFQQQPPPQPQFEPITQRSWASVVAQLTNSTPPLTNQPQISTSTTTSSATNQSPVSFMDPLIPAVVKNTMKSVKENGRYMLARLRDTQVLKMVRLYLSYLHDHPTACHEGITITHCKILISTNGLPTDTAALREIYTEFNSTFGFTKKEVNEDLKALRRYLNTNRISYLKKTKENNNKFYNF